MNPEQVIITGLVLAVGILFYMVGWLTKKMGEMQLDLEYVQETAEQAHERIDNDYAELSDTDIQLKGNIDSIREDLTEVRLHQLDQED